MRTSLIFCLSLLFVFSGCTSFKTTSLFRTSGHKIIPQKTNAPLKGLPVKMKVPSHVNVVVYEQQLILAARKDEREKLEDAANGAANALNGTKREIKGLTATIQDLTSEIQGLEKKIDFFNNQLNKTNDQNEILAIKKLLRATNATLTLKKEDKVQKVDARPILEAELRVRQWEQEAALAVAMENQNPGYRLVSFDPPQYVVDSEIQYTDKVFLVDFKRPAGGILDLTSAKMDDEQYFAQVKAEVTERTVEDISSVLASFTPRNAMPPEAKPTSADTPEAEANPEVHFQKSVVAMKRFDISQNGWEQQMMDFVNGKLQGTEEAISNTAISNEFQAPAVYTN